MLVPSIEATRSASRTLLPASIQCRSSTTRTSGLAPAGRVDEAADDPAQRPLPRLGARAAASGRSGSGTPRKSNISGRSSAKLGVEQQRAAGDLLARQLVAVALADPEEGAQHLQHRQEGSWTSRAPAPAPRRPRTPRARQRSANSWQSRLLPTPGSATMPDRAALAAPRAASSAASQRRHLLGAADEAGEAALAGEVEPRARRADPGQLEDPDRPARALDLELAEVVELEVAGDERRRCARSGRPCRARPAPPSAAPARPCGRSPCSRCRALADRPGHHLAGVDPDPDREVEARAPRRSSAAYSATSSSICRAA